jgi:acetyl-CoA acetyltransferase
MRDIYIVGTGEHPWGKFDDKVFTQLGEVAVAAALKDAGIEWKQIQAIMSGILIYGGNAGHLSGQYIESVFRRDRCRWSMSTTPARLVRPPAANSVAAGETDTPWPSGLTLRKGF